MIGKWNIVNDQSNANYDAENETIYNAKVLKPNFRDFNDAYILERDDINVVAGSAIQGSFESFAPVTKSITENDGTTIDDEDLDLVMPIYNLIKYSSNYSKTTGS